MGIDIVRYRSSLFNNGFIPTIGLTHHRVMLLYIYQNDAPTVAVDIFNVVGFMSFHNSLSCSNEN